MLLYLLNEVVMRNNAWIALAMVGIIIAIAVSGAGATIALLNSTVSTGTTASPSGLELITVSGDEELSMLRGCTDAQILKFVNSTGAWTCQDDSTTAVTGAGVAFSDLSGSAVDSQIPDDITITLAATATALASNPADCGADTKADAMAANGDLTCTAVDTGDITDNTILPTDLNGNASFADEECITFEATGNTFEGQACDLISLSNSFETMDVPAGTDPVASSPNDTLTWTSTGSTITITGDSGTDTINLEAVDVTCTGCLGTTEIAGLDISDDTNLTCGRSLTTSGDGCDADAELFTIKKSITLLDPTTGDTNKVQFEYATTVTITEVSCSVDAGSVTIQFDERARATPNTAGTDVMTSTLVCDTDSETTTTFDNAGIAADVPVNLQITDVTTAIVVRIHIKATKDD